MLQTTRAAPPVAASKVPELTPSFWIVKVLATVVGAVTADLLAGRLGLGATNAASLMAVLLGIALVFQLASCRYEPAIYWITVVMVSVVGTLTIDDLVRHSVVGLRTIVLVCSGALAITFWVWFRVERTVSMRSIDTTRGEAFAWLAILLTFGLGTAVGDVVAERLSIGSWESALLFGAATAVVAALYCARKLPETIGFWGMYLLTWPLGASLGDSFSQSRAEGGLAWGTVTTSAVFLAAIVLVVVALSVSHRDEPRAAA